MRRRPVKLAMLALVLAALPVTLHLTRWSPLNGQDGAGAERERSRHGGGNERRGTPNRLIQEKSPYLLQHAYNPVDWYPWGTEAFSRAAKEDKPIFLSVGYSTCHWCHVMERESFSNPEIAAVMNEHFVSIKVDREERPDVDRVYMTFVQASTGRGGWPMSVFLTPDLKPFFGATYFPPERFKNLLNKMAVEWKNNREKIAASAGKVVETLQGFRDTMGADDFELEKALLDRTYERYASSYDPVNGGFGGAPKFPRPVVYYFLLRYYHRTGEEKALQMVVQTLKEMAEGGIRDHLGGGFHRYSTDGRWLLPHFEKMLYDQAQLAVSYLEAFQLSKDPFFAEVGRGIFDYVLGGMTAREGGFHSAEDADSPLPENPERHGEGAFYVWTYREIAERLGPGDAAVFCDYYGVEQAGNVKQDRYGEFKGKNVLHVAHGIEKTAERFDKSSEDVRRILERSRRKLFEARSRRPRPLRDDKILTAWNGLMISALAKGYQVLGEERCLAAAERAASFLVGRLYDAKSHSLKRRYRDGEVAIGGMIDDYAFFVQGLLDLYETSAADRWLNLALDLTNTQITLFWDEENGGFYNTANQDPSIILRLKEDYDGAEPSPNSIAVLNLLRLSQMANNQRWAKMAEKSIRAFGTRLTRSPEAMPRMMAAVNFYLDKPKQILIAGERDAPDTRALLEQVHRRFIPNKIVVVADGGKGQRRLAENLEILNSLRRIGGKATAYVCEEYVCRLPTNEASVLARLLEGQSGG